MKIVDCVSEAISNTFARPLQTALIAVLSAALAFAAFILPWATVSQAHEMLEQDIAEGRSIMVIGSSGGRISTARCDLFRSVAGVTTAGAVLRSVELRSAGGRPISAMLVTPGLPVLQWPELPDLVPGSIVAPSTENALSSGVPTPVMIDGAEHELTAGGAAISAGRISSLHSIVMIPSSAQSVASECYVEASPGAEEGIASLAAAWFPTAEGARTIPLVPGKPAGSTGQELLSSSPQLWVILCAIGTIVFAVGSSVWSRRHDFAVYQQLGLSHRGSLVMSLVESTITVYVPAAGGVLAAAVVAAIGDVRTEALEFAGASAGMFLLGIALVPVVATFICISVGRSNAGKL
ncbi:MULTISPECIES: hypothetical protein [unclassified Microbacterium]|uniref:hypothetical protein n=1 Tax=unclassified Microbacterium TaxID=2609290 RepID=UPI000CFB2C49|nr:MULTISPECIES: hypothetical protein [unclassified Microbacterium]PQZ55320.1 hypothetical protein CQ032_11480 [Microbacterium sp. MYb43]PQZ73979.1 hypothetical protein CQ031_16660 [Microbacterium sp. MYb40]PRB21100.1 hypothetical protein CQ040_09810 [Microbacterium sp. MYb54]PRB26282.1 hypothetical protein CQ037_13245 [Microbacterium sp. MYb50]PRB66921.1 hypothetical protein CQ021_09500 [Microbacterium sp. MYb24]